jgi:hypothetical protein
MRKHLMTQISSLSKARGAGRCGVSVKPRNAADGLIWVTEGRICTLSGRRYARFMAYQAIAANMPRRQTCKSGQTIPHKQDML